MKRAMRITSDCILIAVLCFSVLFVSIAPVAFADVGDWILTRVTSENEDEYVQAIGTQLATTVHPAYGFMFSTIDDCLELKDMSQSIIYDPATDDGGMALVDENADVGYALAEDGSLIRIDGFYGRVGGGGRSRVDSSEDIKISAFTLAEMAKMYNDHYGPKNTAEYISWRTDARWNEATGTNSNTYGPRLTFFQDGYFCGKTSWNEVYLVPFYTDGTDTYSGVYQFHYWQERTTDDEGNSVITLYCDLWNMVDHTEPVTVTISSKLVTYRHIDIALITQPKVFYLEAYKTYEAFISRSGTDLSGGIEFTSTDTYFNKYVSTDKLSMISKSGTEFKTTVSAHDETCELGTACDIGYYCSNKPIEMDFGNVDFSRFSADDTVTLSGDTFYDYVITNNTTGDTTTVNNYITNNYTYPESDSGDNGEEGGGSAVSGNVNVSGDIDVGGQVDINVNVNNNGASDGSSGNSMPVNVDLNNYLEQTPEQAKPITDFFAIFFDFLPAELLGLICLGVVVAIILRVWGR